MPLDRAPYKGIYENGVRVGTCLAEEVYRGIGNATAAGYEWEPNIPFTASLVVHQAGGSVFRLVDVDRNITYQMFITDMLEAIQRNVVQNGAVHGRFHVIKRNVKYGIKLV